MIYPTIESFIGNTPLVRLQRLPGDTTNILLVKLEGNNPAGSVKDRPAMSMIKHAEARGEIKPGDTLIEATSGNTGIALAMAAAIRGYRLTLIMPEHMSAERRSTMKAFGAEIILVSRTASMEGARDLALQMQAEGKGRVLDQFANPDNPRAHYETTGPEIWRDTQGKITHFVSAMGTTGTIMGTSRFLKEKNPAVQIIGVQPSDGSQIPGIRRWSKEYLPKIYDPRACGSGHGGKSERSRGDDARTRRARRHIRWHLFRRRRGGGVAFVARGIQCRDRRHRVRPWRPLSFHWRVPRPLRCWKSPSMAFSSASAAAHSCSASYEYTRI